MKRSKYKELGLYRAFLPADQEHIRNERKRSTTLRRSLWWKNQLGKGICHYCKKRFSVDALTMDHKIPISRGGKTSKKNVVPSCSECNQSKKYLLTDEWRRSTGE